MLNVSNLFTSTAHVRSHLTNFITVRWKRRPRKPAWMGMAKTKRFKIPQLKELPEWEKTELDRLTYIYNRQFASLKEFMAKDESNKISRTTFSQLVQENLEKSKVLLSEWNAKSAVLRKERLEREKQEQEEAAFKKMMEEEEKMKLIEAKVDAIVTAEIAAGSTFVTKENLDTVLDECLNNIQDYNYALDLQGNIYKGDSTVPTGALKATNVHQMISELKLTDNQSRKKKLK